jgi:cell wall-associated NlpC family hydrolase
MTRLRTLVLVTLGVAAFAASFAPGAASAAPSADDLQKQIDAKGRQLDGVIQQWDGLNEQLTRTTAQAHDLRAQLAPLEAQLATTREQVGVLAAHSYETGNLVGLAALITADSGQSILDRITTLNTIGTQQARQLADYRAAESRLTDQQHQLDQLVAQQRAQKATLDKQKKDIQAQIDSLQQQRAELTASTGSSFSSGSVTSVSNVPAPSSRAQIAVDYAKAQIGKPYVWAASGPNSFDCSGLTMAAWAKAGVQLAHYTYTQIQQTTPISRSQLKPGDLVFFYGGEHVSLYIGNNQVVHAPQPGENVKVSDIDWMGGYYSAGRPG